LNADNNLVILCQPDDSKSCGACCGLYNYVNSSRSSLKERLHVRTRRFRKLVQNLGDIECYSGEILSSEDFRKRYEVIYCCEYLGFLDGEERKVGCLLHPAQNSGIDLRTVSFYGQELCAGHLCPSHHFISASQAQVLIKIIDDWYLYGLCLTDIDLVKTYFRILADKIGGELKPEVFDNAALKSIARQYFDWKITWPFRLPETNRLGKYYFDGSQYMISYIDYARLGKEISKFNTIFLSLSSEFKNAQEIELAEKLVSLNIENFISTYQSAF
jgi:hypothetical protein